MEHLLHFFKASLSNNESSLCHYLLPFEDIKQNIKLFMNLVNASSSSLQKNLTKEVINRGTKMFLYLNSCLKTKTKKVDILEIFQQVFKTYMFEPTNTGIILYTLNVMKLFPNDERKIASKILEKISTRFKLPLIQSQKHNLTLESAKGMSMNGKISL